MRILRELAGSCVDYATLAIERWAQEARIAANRRLNAPTRKHPRTRLHEDELEPRREFNDER